MKKYLVIWLAVATLLGSARVLMAGETPKPDAALEKKITQLVNQLGEADWKRRTAATEEIQRLGKPALPYLQRALTTPDEEIRTRLQFLIASIKEAQGDVDDLGALLRNLGKGGAPKPDDLKNLRNIVQQLLGNFGDEKTAGMIVLDDDGVTALSNNGAMMIADADGVTVIDDKGGMAIVDNQGDAVNLLGNGIAAKAKKDAERFRKMIGQRGIANLAGQDVGGTIVLDLDGSMTVTLDNGGVVITNASGEVVMQNGFEPLAATPVQLNLGNIQINGMGFQGGFVVFQGGQVVQQGNIGGAQPLMLNEAALLQQMLGGMGLQGGAPAQQGNLANLNQMINQLLGQLGQMGQPAFAQGPAPQLVAPAGVASSDLMDTFGAKLGEAEGGLRVIDLKPNSPADKAGLRAGDLITRVNAREAAKLDDVKELLAKPEAGKQLKIEITRKDESLTLTVNPPDIK